MEKTALRIRDLAMRRCGELLKEIEKKHGANQNISAREGTKVLSRKDAAEEAGLSKKAAVTPWNTVPAGLWLWNENWLQAYFW